MGALGILGIPLFTMLLVAIESLQDVYMTMGLTTEFRNKVKQFLIDKFGTTVDDDKLNLFFDSLVDNGAQKVDIVKTVIWANVGMVIVNQLEDKLQENATNILTGIKTVLSKIPMPVKFSIKGATKGIAKDLVTQKQEKVKKLSDYMHQGTLTGATLQNSTNTSSLPTMYKKGTLDKLSPKEQATYKSVMAMLNTVQASR